MSASMQHIRASSAISKEEQSLISNMPLGDGTTKIDWAEQRKLLRKKQVPAFKPE
jgi:hypothetical protein